MAAWLGWFALLCTIDVDSIVVFSMFSLLFHSSLFPSAAHPCSMRPVTLCPLLEKELISWFCDCLRSGLGLWFVDVPDELVCLLYGHCACV